MHTAFQRLASASLIALLCACGGEVPGAATHGPGTSNTGGGGNAAEAPVDCKTVDVGFRRLWRLTPAQYDTSVRDVFGVEGTWGDGFPADSVVKGFRNNADALMVSPLLADKLAVAAEDIAKKADLTRFNACAANAMDATCLRTLTQAIGMQVFRRPLTTDEVSRYAALGDVRLVITAMLQSPHFLYRAELGAMDSSGKYALSDYEVASELSFMLWQSPPDAMLYDAAGKAALHTPEQIRAAASRMLQSEKARPMVRSFVFEWLGLNAIETVPKDTARFPELTDDVRKAMVGEAERFVDHVMVQGDGSLAALLGDTTAFLDDKLKAFYGPTDQGREGVLTLGGIMLTHSRSNDSSPIHRGKLVREKFLCQELPPPPPGIVVQPPPLDPTKTTRERYAAHSSMEPCHSCHQLMDPIGLAFEHFDGVGRYRADDNGKPIDVTGEILLSPNSNGTFNGTGELITKLSQSKDVKDCFALQWMRYAYGMAEDGRGACLATRVQTSFAQSAGTLAAIIGVLTEADQLRYRSAGGGNMTIAPQDAGTAVAPMVAKDPSAPVADAGAPPVMQAGLKQTVISNNDYGTGYCKTYEVTNQSAAPLAWSVVIALGGMLQQNWQSNVTGKTGTVTFTGADYNATLMPGQSAQFGFCVTR